MRFLSKIIGFGLLAACSGLIAGQAQAQTNNTTANLNVELTITPGCSIGFDSGSNGEAGTVSFGSFINLDTPKTEKINLNVRCSKDAGIKYHVGINGGSSKEYTKRTLVNENGKTIAYKICKDSACQGIWGDSGSDIVSSSEFTQGDTMDTHPVYVQVPAQPGIPLYPGLYKDTVIATVTMDN